MDVGTSLASGCRLDGTQYAADRLVDWYGRRVTLMGLGRHGGGLGAARYLAGRGARLTISDAGSFDALAKSLDQLSDLPIERLGLGGHLAADFDEAEVVVVNPAVRLDHPLLVAARRSGALVTSEIELLLRACPARVIGVTGSNGKSTTASMLAAMLAAGGLRTWLGGNIGGSLLCDVDAIQASDSVVLELSSFQLAHLSNAAPRPAISVITNCTPNHLDWHGSFDAYRQAKLRIIHGRSAHSQLVLNSHDSETAAWRSIAGGAARDPWPLEAIPSLAVPGEHNRQNAACAAAAAELAGVDRSAICHVLARFRGLAHRIEPVREVAGRRFYDDSKATTPEASMAALATLSDQARGVWLLAGGQTKGSDYRAWATAVVQRATGVALFGAARALAASLREASARSGVAPVVATMETLPEALEWSWRRSAAGDAILLSPACASLDQFRDFVARGEALRAWVDALTAREIASPKSVSSLARLQRARCFATMTRVVRSLVRELASNCLEADGCEVSLEETEAALGVVPRGFFCAQPPPCPGHAS